MVSHTLVKDVLMELGEETEYYTIKSGDLNLWISDLKRDIKRIGLSVGSNPTPQH